MSRAFALIVVEGVLEIPASLRLLESAGVNTSGLRPIDKGGRERFWRDAVRYNNVARHLGPILGLTDLDSFPCPSGLIYQHLGAPRHADFILRIAERTLESWFLADDALARFLGIPKALLPVDPDKDNHPKQTLVNLARRSRSTAVRRDLVPSQGSFGIVGKGYTPRMSEFVEHYWRPAQAQSRSGSLQGALRAIRAVINT